MSQAKTPDKNIHEVVLNNTGVVTTLLDGVTATGVGTGVQPVSAQRTFHAKLTTSAGNGSATVRVEVSNDNVGWITAGAIEFASAASPQNDGFSSATPWKYVRGNVTAIAGTGAALTLTMGQ